VRSSVALGLVWIATLSAVFASGCDPQGCVDQDEDGLGLRCAMGTDCDDTNPERTRDCTLVPAPDCDAAPSSPGCPCLPEQMETCYRGPTGTRGVGICRAGRTRCVNGHFGLCTGEQLPDLFEACDLEDGDCDGRVDERVTSPCGECDPSCAGGVWGNADAPFTAEAPLALTELGSLTLGQTAVTSAAVWVPNTADGTVSRLDARAALERARHFSAPLDGVGAEPTRLAVDWNGDAWVLNRAFGGQGSVTKIAGDEARCIDRDGDGVITTSRGSSPVPFERDECVLLHVAVGALAAEGEDGSVPRAIAIDGDRGLDGASGGNPWIGLYGESVALELDGLTGEVLHRVELGDVRPYLAGIDSLGVVWMGSQRGVLVRIDPSFDPPDTTRIELPADCYETYSLAIDAADRLYLTGFGCDRVWRFDPSRGELTSLTVPASPRGAALWDGRLWVAHTGGLATEIAIDSFTVTRTIDLDGDGTGVTPRQTIGAGMDSIGHAWMVSETGGPTGGGLASRIDVEHAVVDAHVEVGRAPHAQGDMTGWQRVGEREPEGSARHVFEGCEGYATDWRAVHVHAELGAGGEIAVAVRHAATAAGLASESFEPLGTLPGAPSPLPLELPDGGVVEVQVTLRTRSHRSAPVLELLGVEWDCGGPG
jgi:streptogramin lyase